MSQPLFENLSEISRRISTAPHLLLFLDFDGTLTPIVERPSMAHLSPETKDILIRLSRHDNISIAIISGRALVDIQERVGIENLIYAGNHGMEISGSEFHFVHPKAAVRQEALRQLSEHLATKLRHIAGVKVEQKGLTTSIHYRCVSAAYVDEVVQTVQDVVINASYLFRLTKGKMVCEIRPRVDWHKGAAVSWISDRLGHTKALAIYFGDDTTDEDAFAALSQGITVQVGPSIITSAHYHLADPSEVQKFLHWLAHAIDQGSHHATKKTNTKPNVSGEKMNHRTPFVFYTERRLVALTGLKVKNLPELLSALREVSGSSIFYHTHHQYLSHHFEKPVFYNDFALYVSEALQEERLAEKLAAIDLLTFTTIRQLREAIIATIEAYLRENRGRVRDCPPGDEFHFCKSKSFIMPTGLVAPEVPDFFAKLPHVTNVSLYFHFFEARLRLERPTNDFSQWLYGCGEDKLARAIDKIDPYIMTLDELKSEIIKTGKRQWQNNLMAK